MSDHSEIHSDSATDRDIELRAQERHEAVEAFISAQHNPIVAQLNQDLTTERAAREQAEARLVEAIELLKRWDNAFRAHMHGVRLSESTSLFLSSTTPQK